MKIRKVIIAVTTITMIIMANACGSSENVETTVTETESVTEAEAITVAETEKPKEATKAISKAYHSDETEALSESFDESEGDEAYLDSYRLIHPMNNDLVALDILKAFNNEVQAYIGAPTYKYDAVNGIMEVPDDYLDVNYPSWTALVADWAYNKTRPAWSVDMRKTVADIYEKNGDLLTATFGDGSSERDHAGT